MTKLKISWHLIFLSTWVSENAFCCVFSLVWFIPLGLIRGKKSLDRKYVLLRQAGVKQKCCKVSFVGKKSFFTISKTSGWLLRRSALKSRLLITYLWLYVGLQIFHERIRIRIMQVLEDESPSDEFCSIIPLSTEFILGRIIRLRRIIRL